MDWQTKGWAVWMQKSENRSGLQGKTEATKHIFANIILHGHN